MVLTDWSSFGRIKLGLVIGFVVSFVAGAGIASVEESLPNHAVLIALFVIMGLGATLMGLYVWRMRQTGLADERFERIIIKSASVAWAWLFCGLTLLLPIVTFGDLDIPLIPSLWVLLAGSILVLGLATEINRRQM